jgi:hypothetical protein
LIFLGKSRVLLYLFWAQKCHVFTFGAFLAHDLFFAYRNQ